MGKFKAKRCSVFLGAASLAGLGPQSAPLGGAQLAYHLTALPLGLEGFVFCPRTSLTQSSRSTLELFLFYSPGAQLSARAILTRTPPNTSSPSIVPALAGTSHAVPGSSSHKQFCRAQGLSQTLATLNVVVGDGRVDLEQAP
jgi:hypothetical protein